MYSDEIKIIDKEISVISNNNNSKYLEYAESGKFENLSRKIVVTFINKIFIYDKERIEINFKFQTDYDIMRKYINKALENSVSFNSVKEADWYGKKKQKKVFDTETMTYYENSAVKENTNKTAVYARLSRKYNGVENSTALENQIEYIIKSLERFPDINVADVYSDNGFSGVDFNRKGWGSLLRI